MTTATELTRPDARRCVRQDDGTWKVADNPANRGVVGLACDRHEADPYPRVQGRCPHCGSDSLFLGAGGYVTCSLDVCTEPDAASTILARRGQQPTDQQGRRA